MARLNLTTPSDEVIRTMKSEAVKAEYWCVKQFGGEKKYQEYIDELMFETSSTLSTVIGDVVEWKSKEGNRWMCFPVSYYDKGDDTIHSGLNMFCYYETLGSIGMFVAQDAIGHNEMLYFIYTSHFFERWCERTGEPMRGKQTVIDFMRKTLLTAINIYPESAEGVRDCDISIDGYIFRGKQRADNPCVFEIRTILTESQLTNKQKMLTSKVRNMGKILRDKYWENVD